MAARGEVDKEEGNNSGFMGEYGERGRYRNRVEFKGLIHSSRFIRATPVDIETEWNLKVGIWIFPEKLTSRYRNRVEFKEICFCFHQSVYVSRYRNRVEFKVHYPSKYCSAVSGRYRNRVEFKGLT